MGFTHIAFGDLFLEDVRRYREEQLAGTGLTPLFPLWKMRPTSDLARRDDRRRLRRLSHVRGSAEAPRVVRRPRVRSGAADRSARGRTRAARTASSTRSPGGPMFARPCVVTIGELVERDGFVLKKADIFANF